MIDYSLEAELEDAVKRSEHDVNAIDEVVAADQALAESLAEQLIEFISPCTNVSRPALMGALIYISKIIYDSCRSYEQEVAEAMAEYLCDTLDCEVNEVEADRSEQEND